MGASAGTRPGLPGSEALAHLTLAMISKLSLAEGSVITLRAKVEARKKPNVLAFILKVAREDFVSFFYKLNLSCLQRKHGGREQGERRSFCLFMKPRALSVGQNASKARGDLCSGWFPLMQMHCSVDASPVD